MTGVAAVRPLSGLRVLVPRPAGRATELVDALTDAGAVAEVVELIGIEPPADPSGLDLAVHGMSHGEFGWVAFTSVNAVEAVLARAAELALAPAISVDTRVAAVGPATSRALRSAGLAVDLMPPDRSSAAALARMFPDAVGDRPVLLPRSDLAPSTLPDALAAKGYRVQSVVAYRTVVRPPAAGVAGRLAAGEFTAVLFTSPSTVQALAGVPIVAAFGAIGEPTRAAATAAGREISFVATEPGAHSFVAALIAYVQEA